jgi:pimeloyl-ACP methyl ester carboxylesterase
VRTCLVVTCALILAGCGGSSGAGSAGPTPSESSAAPSATGVVDVLADPVLDQSYPVGPAREQMTLQCFGAGRPTLVLVAGDDSAGSVFPAAFRRPLAELTTTCTYDRLGTGASDPPTDPRRSIDDIVADLHRLLTATGLPSPYLLVGSSGGGNIAAEYGLRHPTALAGLVLLDVGKPTSHLDREFPGPLGWKNPEHIDWVAAERQQSRMTFPVGRFPVLVVTGEDDQAARENQSYWLDLSPDSRQVVVPGGHDMYQVDPQGVVQQIAPMVHAR